MSSSERDPRAAEIPAITVGTTGGTPVQPFAASPTTPVDLLADAQKPAPAPVHANENPLCIGSEFLGYTVVRLLGKGGMGLVYEARQEQLKRSVALKLLRPEAAAKPDFTERFMRECKAMAAVSHPNVVAIHDAGTHDGFLYMVLELMAGGDLARLLARRGRIEQREAIELAVGCAQGLGAIHTAGLVHRDIKPQNIFLDRALQPKIGDLGLARAADGADRMTITGAAWGTPAYMSPEQVRGVGDIDIRSDIYALGATLFTLLTGSEPFEGPTTYIITHKVLSEPIPDPRSRDRTITAPLAAVVLRAMAKNREERYQSPQELLQDLERLRQNKPLLHALIVPAPSGSYHAFGATPTTADAAHASAAASAPPSLLPAAAATPNTVAGQPVPAASTHGAPMPAGRAPSIAPALAPSIAPAMPMPTSMPPSMAGPVPTAMRPAGGFAPSRVGVGGGGLLAVGKLFKLLAPLVVAVVLYYAYASVAGFHGELAKRRAAVEGAPWAATGGEDANGRWAELALGEGCALRLRWIAAGSFTMGSPPSESGRAASETAHTVTISHGFWLGETPCTQLQWARINGLPSDGASASAPQTGIDLQDCENAMKALSARIAPAIARLPSEAEWEYACRAGSPTPFCGGASIESGYGAVGVVAAAWRAHATEPNPLPAIDADLAGKSGDPAIGPHAVGQGKSNLWGLYDLHGNVLQWCEDAWDGQLALPASAETDPLSTDGSMGVGRGGSWHQLPEACRSAARTALPTNTKEAWLGVRLLICEHAAPGVAGGPPAP